MLIVTRKKGQNIILGDNIKIAIIDIKSDSVRIGIEAPKDVRILREEILVEISKQNVQAIINNISKKEEVENILRKNFPKD